MFYGAMRFENSGQANDEKESHDQRDKNESVIHSSTSDKNHSPNMKHSDVMANPASIASGFILPANDGRKYPNTIAPNTSFPTSIQISDNFLFWALLNFNPNITT